MADAGKSYPLPAYNFRVALDGAAMSFSEVSGLQIQQTTVTYSHGLSFMEGSEVTKIPSDELTTVTFKRGTALGKTELAEWIAEKDPRSLEVDLCDAEGVPVVVWRIAKAWATKLSAPTFDAAGNDVAIETLEVVASGISVVHEG